MQVTLAGMGKKKGKSGCLIFTCFFTDAHILGEEKHTNSVRTNCPCCKTLRFFTQGTFTRIKVKVCRRFLTENQLKTYTVSPKTAKPLSPSTLLPPPTFKSSAFWSNPYRLLSLCAARRSLLWCRLTADLKAAYSALYIVPVTPQYTLSKEGLATELYASITNLQRPSCEVAAVLNFKFPSLKKE